MWLENMPVFVVHLIHVVSFNPSSSGCGWKTNSGSNTNQPFHLFQSFFFWMWLENLVVTLVRVLFLVSFNPSSSGCGWKTIQIVWLR